MTTENIKLTFAHKAALQTFTTGLDCMFRISFETVDYITYYNFRRFYATALKRLYDATHYPKKKKQITISIEINIYSSLCKLMLSNEAFLNHSDNSYLKVITLEIMEQGRILLEQKQRLYNAETYGL